MTQSGRSEFGRVSIGGKKSTIQAAKSDHMIWMRKLSQMLAGRAALNPEELADHHSCRLGKWYDKQNDPAFTTLPDWSELEEPHSQVHAAGIKAAQCHAGGDIAGAIDAVLLADTASKEVMRLLAQIAEKIPD